MYVINSYLKVEFHGRNIYIHCHFWLLMILIFELLELWKQILIEKRALKENYEWKEWNHNSISKTDVYISFIFRWEKHLPYFFWEYFILLISLRRTTKINISYVLKKTGKVCKFPGGLADKNSALSLPWLGFHPWLGNFHGHRHQAIGFVQLSLSSRGMVM